MTIPIEHDLLWKQIMLPPNAPSAWNAVEASETQKDSRLAREFNVALPVELDLPEWKSILTQFVQTQFLIEGICADIAEALEKNKSMMVIARYQIIFNVWQLSEIKQTLNETFPVLREHHSMMKKLNPLHKQLKALKQELDECLPIQFIHKKQIQNQMDALCRVMAPFHKSLTDILHILGNKDKEAREALVPCSPGQCYRCCR